MSQFDKIAVALAAPPGRGTDEPRDDWLDAMAIFRIMRRRIWIILLVSVAVFAAAIMAIMNMKDVYAAQSRLLIRQSPAAGLQRPIFGPEMELNLANEIERLLSRDVAAQVIADLDLASRPEFNSALRSPTLLSRGKTWVRDRIVPPGDPPDDIPDGTSEIVLAFLGHLAISGAAGSQVVSIEFLSEDPELAAQVPNALVRIYLEQRAGQFSKQLDAARGWLDRRIDEQRQHVALSDQAAKGFRETSEIASLESLDVASIVSALNERRASIGLDRSEIETRLTALKAIVRDERWQEAEETPGQPGLVYELFGQRNTLRQLRETYGANHPDVLEAQNRLDDTENLMRANLTRQMLLLETRLASSDREDAAIATRLDAASTTLSKLRRAEAELAALEREAQSEQATLDALEEQRRALRAEADIPVADVEVLLPATVPLAPLGRSRTFYLFIAIFGAGALGLAVALMREMLDGTVRSSDHVREVPGAAPVGLLPKVAPGRLPPLPGSDRDAPETIFTDALRATIFALEQGRGGKMPKSVLVTSAVAGEGKTTLAAAMAAELLASGYGVLLVDGHLGVGTLHRSVACAAEPGLSDYLAGKVDLAGLEQLSDSHGFGFIGRGASQSQWHLDRSRLSQLVETATGNGRIVIFDSAPVLATAFTPVLGSIVERRLLVVRWGTTGREALATAVQRLKTGNGDDVEVAINRVNLRRQELYGFSDAGEVARTMRNFGTRMA